MTESTYDDVKRIAWLSSGQTINGFHKSTHCAGDVCPLHKPSNHEYRRFPLAFDMMVFSFFRIIDEDTDEKVVDPDDYNLNQRGSVILENSARCLSCNTKIISIHRHNFVTCPCGKISVDGGSSYLRRVGDPESMEDTSVVYHKPQV